MVKRNKLNLTVGILLIIVAGLSFISVIDVIEDIVAMLQWYSSTGTPIDMSLIGVIFIFAYMIALYLAQTVVYLIFGIKIIKKSKLYNSFESSKTLLIVSLVLVSCSLLFDPYSYLKITYLALIVLLILAICNGKKSDEENLKAVNTLNETLHSSDNETASAENITQDKLIQTENVKTDLPKESTENAIASNQNMMTQKVIALKSLKDNGVISQDEFDKMVGDVLDTSVAQKTSSKATKRATSPKSTTQKSKPIESTKKSTTKSSKPTTTKSSKPTTTKSTKSTTTKSIKTSEKNKN